MPEPKLSDQGDSYPYEDGDTIVLGPHAFVAKDGSVLNWRGQNYYPTVPWDQIEEAVMQGVGAGAGEVMSLAPDVVMPTEDCIRVGQLVVASLREGEMGQ